MKAICLPRRNRSSFWAFCSSRLTFFLNWEFWMILFRAEPIRASSISKFGNFFPETDREDLNSSNESSVSTSLIQNIASDGKSEHAVTWFLIRIFQTKNDWELWNLSSDICCLCCPNHRILRKIHRCERTHSRRPSCECRHWNCVFTLFVISCEKSHRPLWAVELILVLFVVRKSEFLEDDLGSESNVENWLPKTFSCNPDVFHVSRGKRLWRLSMERELGTIASRLGT